MAATSKAEDQAMLSSVNDAINSILAGGVAQYSTGNRQVTKVSLNQLMELKTRLEARIDAATSGSFAVAKFTAVR